MKICTYNVNSIRARIELILKWLEKREHDLDILCLQEIKATEEVFPFQQFAELGYHTAIYGQPKYNGVAVCSRSKPEIISRGVGDEFWDRQKRVVSCKINGITFINVYAPHGGLRGEEKYDYKQKWYEFFLSYLQEHYSPRDPLAVVGDFNVTLTDNDIHDAELLRDSIGTMPEERNALQGLLDWGLADAYRHLNPEERAFTWWSYLGGGIWKDEGMRIDYILCTNSLLQKIENVEIDLWPRRRRKPTPSDHAPVIAAFNNL